MSDFIDEVDEQLRADRYRELARKTLPWFLAAVAAVVVGFLGAWGYQHWRDQNIDKASIAYDKATNSLLQGDETGAYAAFEPVAKNGPAGYRTLALIQQGNIRLNADKTVEAVALYDAAAKAAPNAILGDQARLKAALALLDTTPYAQEETRLKALIGPKKPYDLEAREALAFAKMAAGKTAEAKTDFSALMLMLGVTDGMRQRAQTAIAVIDSGQAKVAVDIAKLSATLPPPAPQMLQQPPGGPAPQGAPAAQDAPQDAPRTAQ
ncbi:MAG: tetratricopeptide repeat protein [Proteobacteria bacterium]|nr:tetratricopeptide repeat protein [Pseudomonadota bacterium]